MAKAEKTIKVELTETQARIVKFLLGRDITEVRSGNRYANAKEIIEADEEIIDLINEAKGE